MKKVGSVDVLGRKIAIYRTKKMPEGTEHFWAYYDVIKRIIVMNDSNQLPDNIKKEIFFHELQHALMDRAGFNVTSMTDDTHELLSEAFKHFVSDNFEFKDKKLLARILKK